LHEIDLADENEKQTHTAVQNLEGAPPKPISSYTLFVKDFKQKVDSGEVLLVADELGRTNFIP
jgi:hypothetical protein